MHILNYMQRFQTLHQLIRERNIETRETEARLSTVCEDGPEADLLRIITLLMGDLAKRSARSSQARDLIAGLIGHVVVERSTSSAPRCLRLVREIVATPGDAFAIKLAVISDGSNSTFVKETLARALAASKTELAFVRIEALAALPSIEGALLLAADYTRIVP
jgi:hypothetical protein